MPTTTNFSWTTPADTDYVKDGASAIRTLANGIDTSMAQLKGGTTGQILSKTNGTDMAFTWINNDQGDITAVVAGNGLSGGATSGSATLAIDTAITVDKTTAQTLTNKTISGLSNTISNISLTTGVTGTLPIANGGTNITTFTTGDLPYASASNTLSKLAIGTTGQVLTVSGGVPTWATAAAGGKVLQVVAATYSTQTTTTSATYADSGLTATITPSATTSKILVMIDTNGILTTGSSNARGGLKLLRGTTSLAFINTGLAYVTNSGNGSVGGWGASLTYLDSPSTTSATTYKTQVNNNGGAGTVYFQFNDGTNTTNSSIVLLEIGA